MRSSATRRWHLACTPRRWPVTTTYRDALIARSETDVAAIGTALAAALPNEVYVLHLIRPPTEGDNSQTDERVVSYVMSFDDDASASAGFAAWAAAWQERYPSESTSASVGDEQFVVAGRAQEADGSRFPLVHLAFRAGTIVSGVSVEFFTGFAPEREMVEALAASQHERIESVLAEGGPGLAGRIVHFDVPGIRPSTAVYGIRAGQRSYRDSDTAVSATESQATATAAGIVDQFQIEQQLAGEPGGASPPFAFYSARIVTFTGADTGDSTW